MSRKTKKGKNIKYLISKAILAKRMFLFRNNFFMSFNYRRKTKKYYFKNR